VRFAKGNEEDSWFGGHFVRMIDIVELVMSEESEGGS